MADKFIYIPNDDTQNYPFCTLKLVVETFMSQPIKKFPKLLSQQIRNRYYKTSGISLINIPLSPIILCLNLYVILILKAESCKLNCNLQRPCPKIPLRQNGSKKIFCAAGQRLLLSAAASH